MDAAVDDGDANTAAHPNQRQRLSEHDASGTNRRSDRRSPPTPTARALLDQPRAVEDEDAVSASCDIRAVRDDDRRPAAHHRLVAIDDHTL